MTQLLTRAGERVTGHEFHRTTVEPAAGDVARLAGRRQTPVGVRRAETLHASYLHMHWAGHPQLAQRFAERSTPRCTARFEQNCH